MLTHIECTVTKVLLQTVFFPYVATYQHIKHSVYRLHGKIKIYGCFFVFVYCLSFEIDCMYT